MRRTLFALSGFIALIGSGCSLPSLPDFGLLGGSAGNNAASRPAQRSISGGTESKPGPSSSIASVAYATAPLDASVVGAPGAASKLGVGPFYPRAYALVIGMDDYAYLPKLKNAVGDSNLVSEALKAHGFVVTHKKNLNSQGLRDALEEFFYQTGSDKEASLLLWYAGHGHTIGGEGYLLPVDTPSLRGNDVDFRRRAYSMRNFSTLLREARAHHVLAVFDSCFAGTIFKNTRAAAPPAIEQANKYHVRQFIAAGDHTQEVADDGSFQRAFVAAIMGQDATADSDRNGFVTGEELGIFMKNRLVATSGGTQTPQFGKLAENEFDRGDFIFRVGAPSGIVSPPPAYTVAAGPRAGSRDPLAHMSSTKVYVAAVYGAPGDGNAALRQALSDRLANQGFQVVDYDTEFAFKVHGTVQKRSAGVLMDEMTIKWQVFGINREPIGLIEEKLEVLSGARDGLWGETADKSAAFAADRLPKFLARPS